MGHDTCTSLLFDVLSDFPANAILQRVGLLETLLDVIGSVVLSEEQGQVLFGTFVTSFKILMCHLLLQR